MEPADRIERAIEQLHMKTKAETDRRILDDAFAALLGSASRQPSRIEMGRRPMPAIRWIAIPAAVAAMILIGLIMFEGFPLQKTASFEQIQTTLAKVDNICISTFRAGETEPFQQIWASKPLAVQLFKVGKGNRAQFTLWDVPNGTKKTKFVSSGHIQTETVAEPVPAELQRFETEFYGLIPVADANGVLADAQWNLLDEPEAADQIPGTKVYDLTWTTESTVSRVGTHRRWRLFADARTNMPRRAEWHTKLTPEDEYGFEIFAVVTYPTEGDIDNLLRSTFGPRLSDDPVPIGTPGADR